MTDKKRTSVELGEETFSIAPTAGPARFIRDKVYPFIPFFSLFALSLGSGITTFIGMTNYADWIVALAITIGVQSFMFVFAIWLSVLKNLRNSRGLLVFFGFVIAASVSVFFSFAAFFDQVSSAADERQASNLELRNKWAEIFARISDRKSASILRDSSEILQNSDYQNFVDKTRSSIQLLNQSLNAIEAQNSAIEQRIQSIEAGRGARLNEVNARWKSLSTRIEALRQDNKNRRDQIASIEIVNEHTDSRIGNVIPDATIEDRIQNDKTLESLRSTFDVISLELASKTAELEAKRSQIEQERTRGGTQRDDGTVSRAGVGPHFRRYSDEALVLEQEVSLISGRLKEQENQIEERLRRIRKSWNDELELAEAEAQRRTAQANVVLADRKNQREALLRLIQQNDDEIVKLSGELSELQLEADQIGTLTEIEIENASYRSFLNSVSTLKSLLEDTSETPLIVSVSGLPQALQLSSSIEAANRACREGLANASLIRSWLYKVPSSAELDLVCPSLPIQNESGRTLNKRAQDLQTFIDQCEPTSLPRPLRLQDVTTSDLIDRDRADAILRLATEANGSGSGAAEARDQIEKLRYIVDYASVRNKIQDCLGVVNLQSSDGLSKAQDEITKLLNDYNPEAHPFTATVVAFERGDSKATIALILSVAVDVLILIFGLGSRSSFNGQQTPLTPHGQKEIDNPSGLTDEQFLILQSILSEHPKFLLALTKTSETASGQENYRIALRNKAMRPYLALVGELLDVNLVTYAEDQNAVTVSPLVLHEIQTLIETHGIDDNA